MNWNATKKVNYNVTRMPWQVAVRSEVSIKLTSNCLRACTEELAKTWHLSRWELSMGINKQNFRYLLEVKRFWVLEIAGVLFILVLLVRFQCEPVHILRSL